MSAVKHKQFIDNCIFVFLLILMFVEPLSTTAKSVFLVLSVITILSSSVYRYQLRRVFLKKWSISAVLFVVTAVIGCLYGPANIGQKIIALEKYCKVLYIPVLALGFQYSKTRLYGFHAFLAAMLLTSMLSILEYYHIIGSIGISYDYIFRNHIMTGIMMSFGAYLCLFLAFRISKKYWQFYIIIWSILTYQNLFISTGRTGYILYFLLMAIALVQLFSTKKVIEISCVVLFLFFIFYQISPAMHQGINAILHEWLNFSHNKNTSFGIRWQMHQYSEALFWRHSLFGNGLGSFSVLIQAEHPINTELLDPHSQYWLIASELGLLGLFMFAFFVYTLLSACLRIKEMGHILCALLVIFLVGGLSDTLLFYSGSGYFFILFLALCLSEDLCLTNHPASGNESISVNNNLNLIR